MQQPTTTDELRNYLRPSTLQEHYRYLPQLRGRVNIVRLGGGEYGVYGVGCGSGKLGTPLLLRGTRDEVCDFYVRHGLDTGVLDF